MRAKSTRAPELMRLNKAISHRSGFSRREADELIKEARVKVNDKVCTNLSTEVDKDDIVLVDDKPLKPLSSRFTMIAYNKKRGELVTKSDPRGRQTIYDSLPKEFASYIPVGRLDYASEGLLLLTDSPKVATRLMKSKLERVYNIKVDGFISEKVIEAMQKGIELKDATKGAHLKSEQTEMTFAPFFAFKIKKNSPSFSRLSVAISEGQNRELRRFFAHFDLKVMDLKRIEFGGITLSALPNGEYRALNKKEYADLKKFISEEEYAETDSKNKTQNRNGRHNKRN